jgi:hypothetical protein
MESPAARPESENSQSSQLTPVPRKRFRVEKLEERIAPAAHYNPQSKLVGGGGGGGGGGSIGDTSGESSGSFY